MQVDNDKKELSYNRLVMGALLKLDRIDNVDFSLIVRDFLAKQNESTPFSWELFWNGYSSCIDKNICVSDDGTISLFLGSLDDCAGKSSWTVRDYFTVSAGSIINEYFEDFDVQKFQEEKARKILEYKKRALAGANILLLSDDEEDYSSLVEYGFSHIDWFKSNVRANEYFSEHPEELEKYHVILKGHQAFSNDISNRNLILKQRIDCLAGRKPILLTLLQKTDYADHLDLVVYLRDSFNERSWDTLVHSYSELWDRIVDSMLINDTLDRCQTTAFTPANPAVCGKRLPLPSKKKNLKILYLGYMDIYGDCQPLASRLGLDITFINEDNMTLGRHLFSNLGDFDIIIGSKMHSENLIWLNKESTEQCNVTGRDLTLLVTYEDFFWGVDTNIASGIRLKYSYGGNEAPYGNVHDIDIKALIGTENDYFQEACQNGQGKLMVIISSAVNLYNDALVQGNHKPLEDLDFKRPEEFTSEYNVVWEQKMAEDRKMEDAIAMFDELSSQVIIYLNFLKNGLIHTSPEGLSIIDKEDSIRVEMRCGVRILCSITLCGITFPGQSLDPEIRKFEIEVANNKGILSKPRKLGLYMSGYPKDADVPPLPNEKEVAVLASIYKKVQQNLIPLNDGVRGDGRRRFPRKPNRKKRG